MTIRHASLLLMIASPEFGRTKIPKCVAKWARHELRLARWPEFEVLTRPPIYIVRSHFLSGLQP